MTGLAIAAGVGAVLGALVASLIIAGIADDWREDAQQVAEYRDQLAKSEAERVDLLREKVRLLGMLARAGYRSDGSPIR